MCFETSLSIFILKSEASLADKISPCGTGKPGLPFVATKQAPLVSIRANCTYFPGNVIEVTQSLI